MERRVRAQSVSDNPNRVPHEMDDRLQRLELTLQRKLDVTLVKFNDTFDSFQRATPQQDQRSTPEQDSGSNEREHEQSLPGSAEQEPSATYLDPKRRSRVTRAKPIYSLRSAIDRAADHARVVQEAKKETTTSYNIFCLDSYGNENHCCQPCCVYFIHDSTATSGTPPGIACFRFELQLSKEEFFDAHWYMPSDSSSAADEKPFVPVERVDVRAGRKGRQFYTAAHVLAAHKKYEQAFVDIGFKPVFVRCTLLYLRLSSYCAFTDLLFYLFASPPTHPAVLLFSVGSFSTAMLLCLFPFSCFFFYLFIGPLLLK
jgi:hypothetical protein